MQMELSKERLFSDRALVRLIIPLIIEQLLAILVGMADTVMVAKVGESAVSAISLVDNVNLLLINIFTALATGGSIVISQYLGRRDREKARLAAEQMYVIVTALSLFVMAVIYLAKPFILNVVFGKIEADVYAHSETYLLIVAASIPFIAVYNSGAAVFRAMGNTRVAMITSVMMNLINVGGNAIMIYGLKMGVAGAAIPTLVSRLIAAVVITFLLRNVHLEVNFAGKISLKPVFSLIRSILRVGIPSGIENGIFQFGKVLILSLVSSFGTASITANAVGNSIGSFHILPASAMGLAFLTVIARCMGSGDVEQAKYYTKRLMLITYGVMVVWNLGLFFLTDPILSFYGLSEETYSLSYEIMVLHSAVATAIWPLAFSFPNVLRASGDVRFTMIVSVTSMWICRVILSYVLGRYLGMGIFGVWAAMMIDWVFRMIFFLIRYFRGTWAKKKVID